MIHGIVVFYSFMLLINVWGELEWKGQASMRDWQTDRVGLSMRYSLV